MSAMDDHVAYLNAQIESLLSMDAMGNSQQQWEAHVKQSGVGADVQGEDDRPHRTGNEMFMDKNRIFAGGTGDVAQRNKSGIITGYSPKVKAGGLTPGLDRQAQMQADRIAGAPLATASATPGLTALHKANPGMTYSWQRENPLIKKAFSAPDTAEMAKKIFS